MSVWTWATLLAAQHSTQLSAVHDCCPYSIAEYAGRRPTITGRGGRQLLPTPYPRQAAPGQDSVRGHTTGGRRGWGLQTWNFTPLGVGSNGHDRRMGDVSRLTVCGAAPLVLPLSTPSVSHPSRSPLTSWSARARRKGEDARPHNRPVRRVGLAVVPALTPARRAGPGRLRDAR